MRNPVSFDELSCHDSKTYAEVAKLSVAVGAFGIETLLSKFATRLRFAVAVNEYVEFVDTSCPPSVHLANV